MCPIPGEAGPGGAECWGRPREEPREGARGPGPGSAPGAPRLVLLSEPGGRAELCSPRGSSACSAPSRASDLPGTFLPFYSVERDPRKKCGKYYPGEDARLALGLVFHCEQPSPGSGRCGRRQSGHSRGRCPISRLPPGLGVSPARPGRGGHCRGAPPPTARPGCASRGLRQRPVPGPGPAQLLALISRPGGSGGQRAEEGGRAGLLQPGRIVPSGNEILAARRVRCKIEP